MSLDQQVLYGTYSINPVGAHSRHFSGLRSKEFNLISEKAYLIGPVRLRGGPVSTTNGRSGLLAVIMLLRQPLLHERH
eukprot:3004671-Pyramimonas_sp.AAC.1